MCFSTILGVNCPSQGQFTLCFYSKIYSKSITRRESSRGKLSRGELFRGKLSLDPHIATG